MRKRFFCLRGRAVLCIAAVMAAACAAAFFPVRAANPEGALPVIMYHSVLRDRARAGAYVVSPDVIEADLRYLRERGYTSLTPSEVAALVQAGEPIPEKSVMITLDDGFLNNLTYVLPLLERYDMTAAIAVVGSYAERFSDAPDPNPAYAYLNWEEICALQSSGRVEIANHSYAMHDESPRKGSARLPGESDEDYRTALTDDATKTQELLAEHCGIIPTTFVYPFGSVGEGSAEILREMGFTVLLTCDERVNILSPDSAELPVVLGRFNRASGISTEKFMKKLGIV
jgi:peptidoglycan/xylan/chitin deacetylase (PgdA/CDA1 family)